MRTGQIAPDFHLPDAHGGERSLGDMLADGPVVLFFYPAADTRVCTAEACHFRDLADEFAAVHATRVGISADPVDALARWSAAQALDFPLLSDADGAVADLFGVRRRGLLRRVVPVKRTTFVIDTDRRVLDVVASELHADVHADSALTALRSRGAGRCL